MTILAVTGHRPNRLGGFGDDVLSRLRSLAERHIKSIDPDHVILGMALGWDTACAQVCVRLRVPFVAAIPFRGQEKQWPDAAQARYHDLLGLAREVVIVSRGDYTNAKMRKRNCWMIDRCSEVLTLWNGRRGGTGQAVNYALSRGLKVTNVWREWDV